MDAAMQLLHWLDAQPVRYWTLAWLLLGITVVLALVPPDRKRGSSAPWWAHAGWFATAAILTIAAFRWPVWFHPGDINPDESQTIAGAITLDQFPVYWRDVDGTTHGPWCEYFLLLAHWLGAPLNFFTARVVATLLQAVSALAVWGVLRSFAPERVARLAALPTLAFWAMVSWDDFVHYSSELPGMFFLALAGWLAAPVLSAPALRRGDRWLMGAAGVCLGAIPFAKLQGVPLGIAAAGVLLVLLWRRREWHAARERLRLAAWLIGGGLIIPVIVSVFLSVSGQWREFWSAYIESALAYTRISQHPPIQMPAKFLLFSATSTAFAFFFWGSVAFALLHARTRGASVAHGAGRAIGWLLLAVAFYSVLRPAREVAHYLQLLVTPLGWLSGFALAAAWSEETLARAPLFRRATTIALWLLLTTAPQIYDRAVFWNRFVGYLNEHRTQALHPTAAYLRDHAQPADRVAMWGWEPYLLVESGLPHGTREAHTAAQLTEWPMKDFYLQRYAADLQANRPRWFLDVVGPGSFMFEHRQGYAHEVVPVVREWVARHYELVKESGHHRLYRWKGE